MQFLTQVLGRTVFDSFSEPLGKVRDVIVTRAEPLPIVSAVVVSNGGDVIVPWQQVREEVDRLSLPVRKSRVPRYEPEEDDIWVKKAVLDRQIVDTHDYKVVRVNDVRFVEAPGEVRLLGVDASPAGLLRELRMEWLAKLMRVFGIKLGEKIIAWDKVETLAYAGGPIKLKVPYEKLSRLHPADIADIIEQMNPMQRADVIESLDVETAADVLPEASPEIQAEIIEDIDPDRASDILEEMDPDEAADILGDLPEERTEEILKEMEPDEAEDVRELLSYEDETAGGLMTTDYVAVSNEMTAEQTINHLRELAPDAETVYYVYVVGPNERLVGVISLRDLIVAQPGTLVRDFMVTRVIHVHPEATLREAAESFQKYNLLALPVVEYDGELKGIVTVDDMLEHIPIEAWRGRRGRRQTAPEQALEHEVETQ